MIHLYGFRGSPSVERVALALAHKALRTEWLIVDPQDREEVRRVSGQDLVPVIKDAGNVIHGSTAILRYLDRHYPTPPLFPTDPARRAEVLLFADWFNHRWMAAPNLLVAKLEEPEPDKSRIDRLAGRMQEELGNPAAAAGLSGTTDST